MRVSFQFVAGKGGKPRIRTLSVKEDVEAVL
jgi:hypothetical protein